MQRVSLSAVFSASQLSYLNTRGPTIGLQVDICTSLWSKLDPTHDVWHQRCFNGFIPEFPICTFVLFLIQIVSEGFEAVWLSIAGECAKPNLKYFSDFFSWQTMPVIGGVAFVPIKNDLQKVTLYLSKIYHFITFSDQNWTDIK